MAVESIPDVPFGAHSLVTVTLNSPREKFWGSIIALDPAGISIRGITLDSFEDFASQLRAGESVVPGTVFFPMHRIERVELDTRNGEVPAMAERFQQRAGVSAAQVFGTGGRL